MATSYDPPPGRKKKKALVDSQYNDPRAVPNLRALPPTPERREESKREADFLLDKSAVVRRASIVDGEFEKRKPQAVWNEAIPARKPRPRSKQV